MQPADKAGMRALLGARRRKRTAEQIGAARARIREHVLVRCAGSSASTVAAYTPMRTEPGSHELLEALHALGLVVLIPTVLPDKDLAWLQHPGGLACGVDAIADADLVLVPALAVARDGTRLGRGGGSYDRALTRIRPGTDVAALLFDGELVDELPRDPWDVAATAVVTPSGWQPVGESGARRRR